ncbi:MazG family protein [Methylocella silvestris BL2]|uniref:Nucleoside triphosphate pyrophosphohydrolase n=1 Tax=Methylocella silvestris (strain DSM 15510 / CIP 108128 / LMG 27833 / NCIMB 13906 / BL2) TaxID=395965 RepID=B8ELC0_METSB|nr:nucleoside triphosphate pyrophosphohydrolase [Methylocella silvestris]ACK49509.1 MazG family protein [Methylocella silvestris BL2]
MQPSTDIQRLLEIMAALRTPGSGCAWDLAQTFETIAPYTIEEAYEVADAIGRRDLPDLKDELGDLLLQVAFHARIAEELGAFDFGGVVEAITAKMIRRHPHVFAKQRDLPAEEISKLWSRIKAEEKAAKLAANSEAPAALETESHLDGAPLALPGLTRAVKLQAKASEVGFDWNDARLVLHKIREETDEIEAALASGEAKAIADEIGDLLFAVANLARHVKADPESAVRRTNMKFARRFRFIEQELERRKIPLGQATLAEMDTLWNDAKALERAPKHSAASVQDGDPAST